MRSGGVTHLQTTVLDFLCENKVFKSFKICNHSFEVKRWIILFTYHRLLDERIEITLISFQHKYESKNIQHSVS